MAQRWVAVSSGAAHPIKVIVTRKGRAACAPHGALLQGDPPNDDFPDDCINCGWQKGPDKRKDKIIIDMPHRKNPRPAESPARMNSFGRARSINFIKEPGIPVICLH